MLEIFGRVFKRRTQTSRTANVNKHQPGAPEVVHLSPNELMDNLRTAEAGAIAHPTQAEFHRNLITVLQQVANHPLTESPIRAECRRRCHMVLRGMRAQGMHLDPALAAQLDEYDRACEKLFGRISKELKL